MLYFFSSFLIFYNYFIIILCFCAKEIMITKRKKHATIINAERFIIRSALIIMLSQQSGYSVLTWNIAPNSVVGFPGECEASRRGDGP